MKSCFENSFYDLKFEDKLSFKWNIVSCHAPNLSGGGGGNCLLIDTGRAAHMGGFFTWISLHMGPFLTLIMVNG